MPDGVEVTAYPVMFDPPVEEGADHVNVPLRGLPDVALKLTLVGALGAVDTCAATLADAALTGAKKAAAAIASEEMILGVEIPAKFDIVIHCKRINSSSVFASATTGDWQVIPDQRVWLA